MPAATSPQDKLSPDKPGTDQLAEDLRRLIGNLVRTVRAGSQTPSTAQSETLGLIDRDGPCSISAMAAHRNVKHQSMRLVVSQLEQQHLVTRAPDPADARKQIIGLTEQGRRALDVSRHQRSDWLGRRLKEKATPEERLTLEAAIRILENLMVADER